MKKLLSTFFALLLILSLTLTLAACNLDFGGGDDDGDDDGEGGLVSGESLTEDEWEALFDIDNVTVNAVMTQNGKSEPAVFKIYDGKAYLDGEEYGDESEIIAMFDFSRDFSNFNLKNGVYFTDEGVTLATHFHDVEYHCTNVKVKLDKNGKIAEITYKAEDEGESMNFTFTLFNYGKTTADSSEQTPSGGGGGSSSSEQVKPESNIDETAWKNAFDYTDTNVTVVARVGSDKANTEEAYSYYIVDGAVYVKQGDSVENVTESGREYLWISAIDFSDSYSMFDCVSSNMFESDFFIKRLGEENVRISNVHILFDFSDVTKLSKISFNVDNPESPELCYFEYEFYDYGTTEAPDLGGNEGNNPTPPEGGNDGIDLSESEWRALFDNSGNNVTVTLLCVNGADPDEFDLMIFKLVDGVEYLSHDGVEFVESSSFEYYVDFYDFSEYYSYISVDEGIYYADKFPMQNSNYTYYKDLVVAAEGGILDFVSYAVTYFCNNGEVENVPESDWTYVTVMFSDYGTTEAPDAGGDEGGDASLPVPEEEWRAAFDFSNVTVQGAASMGTQGQTAVLKFSGDKVYVGYDGEEPTDGGSPLNYTPTFDFSAYYDKFTFEDGIYYVDTFFLYQGYEVFEVYITLNEDGKLASLSYYLDYQHAGYLDGMMYYEYTFFDYGETVLAEGEELEVRLWYLPGNYLKHSDFSDYGECFFGGEDSFYSFVYGYEPWVPGKTRVMYFSIYNTSPLVLNFAPYFDLFKTESNLGECIQYQVISNAEYGDNVTVTDGKYVSYGENALELDAVTIDPYTEYFFALVIKMDVSVGNEYMNGEIYFNFDVRFSTVDKEEDEFGPGYDA